MRRGPLSNVVDYLCAVASARDGAGDTDGELLERFVRRRDENAFEILMRRHGPMVLGVCRRVLGNSHDAEDAFQAVFLLLVRKGASIWPRNQVGNWLYGVAQRTALEARRLSAQRRAKEAQVVPRTETPEDIWDAWRPRLDEEIARLPAKYRAVLVLCDLEGKRRKEAAEHLRIPEGTVASRLDRARSLLAKRLTRGGLVLTGAVVEAMLSPTGASACLPAALVVSTRQAARLFAVGMTAEAALSAKAVTLMEGVVKTMLWAKLKSATTVLLVLCVLGGGGGWLVSRLTAVETPKKVADTADKPAPADKPKPKQQRPRDDKAAIRGTWRITAVEVEGENEFDPKAENPKMVFVADKLILKPKVPGHGVRLLEGAYQLDATKTPKTLDITHQLGKEKRTLRAIYSLEGDVLKICYRLLPAEIKQRDQNRGRRRPFDVGNFLATLGSPKELATKEGSKTLLVTLKREANGAAK